VLIYVDDIIITGSDDAHISLVISVLMEKFKMKDLGPLRYFLGVEVDRHNDSLTLSQHKYICDILHATCMEDCKPLNNPCILNHKLSAKVGLPYHYPTLYRRIVGMMQYLTFTRPDIAYVINQTSQFMHAPTDCHMESVKRILRYLKGTVGDGLKYTSDKRYPSCHFLPTYSDADWAGDPDERRSVSGYCVYIGHNVVTWSNKKQKTVARSSIEAEYRAMAAG
ncbi:reverse transcriptase domain-containing protein, partial [Klebsiella pneumoniae]|uniref:Ty1/Copia family ribonuclease HI n=1 Tax=Klebsiella pneumoniae TaxID=573 RepID=UPI003A80663F